MKSDDTETRRLDELRMHRIMDSAAEKAFDDLTRLAATICETPIGLISLVDDKRQWFKSRYGLDATETPREQAFCAHAIQQDELMVVEDASKDKRFINNPLVTGDMGIRFYAGAPLKMGENLNIGTLCIIDQQPRTLNDNQRESLEVLRDAVVAQLELRRAIADIDAMQSLLPMCSWCRNVKVDSTGEEQWQPLHEYVADLTPVTHGICPGCLESARKDG